MSYVDGFLAAVPLANKARFIEHAHIADALFIEFGALRVTECWSDDVPHGTLTDFYRAVQANYSKRTFKHILVPVWLVSYTYGARSFQVLANGYTGELAGERPYSAWKIFFAVLGGVLALLVLMYVLGMAQ